MTDPKGKERLPLFICTVMNPFSSSVNARVVRHPDAYQPELTGDGSDWMVCPNCGAKWRS